MVYGMGFEPIAFAYLGIACKGDVLPLELPIHVDAV